MQEAMFSVCFTVSPYGWYKPPPPPNTNHTSYLQENRTVLTEDRPWPYMYTTQQLQYTQ